MIVNLMPHSAAQFRDSSIEKLRIRSYRARAACNRASSKPDTLFENKARANGTSYKFAGRIVTFHAHYTFPLFR